MTREQLIEFFNSQVVALDLDIPRRITVESATQMTFRDLTSDSLEALQLAMAIEDTTGSVLELSELQKCATLLDAVDLIASRAK